MQILPIWMGQFCGLNMDHKFTRSTLDILKCDRCKRSELDHSDQATCESCPNIGIMNLSGGILLCRECIAKEIETSLAHQSPELQEQRLKEHRERTTIIAQSRAIDSSIQVRTDLFNAATISIIELKSAIDSDETIANKNYTLAEELSKRFHHFKKIIFEKNEEIISASNNQKAIQVYLNQLANSLRVEEREKLKITDINYKPGVIKPIVKKVSVKKLDKVELRKFAAELGIPEFTLQMLVVSKGWTVEQAANHLRKSINESKSMTS